MLSETRDAVRILSLAASTMFVAVTFTSPLLALSSSIRAQYPAPPLRHNQEAVSLTAPAGILASFLAKTKNADVTKKSLGSLTGRGDTKATFTAIVASDPTDRDLKIKGIEIKLEDGKQKVTAYLDDDREKDSQQDSLKEFQDQLADWADKSKALEYVEKQHPGATDWETTTGALNRPGDQAEYCCPRYTVFNAGWYRRGKESGVTMDAVTGGTFYFANAPLSELVEIIKSGREYLDKN